MARKLTPMLHWMNEQVAERTSGRNLTPSQRAKIFRQIGTEARKRFKK